MRRPFHSSLALRRFYLFSFVALSVLAGCGKSRSLFSHTKKGADNPHSVTITWTASVSPIAGYTVYRASPPSSPARLTSSLVSDTQYIDRTVEAGHTYSYSVTSVDSNGIESKPSGNITVTVPTTVTPPAKQ
jgi:fibronectin type 3 domain-containing protein